MRRNIFVFIWQERKNNFTHQTIKKNNHIGANSVIVTTQTERQAHMKKRYIIPLLLIPIAIGGAFYLEHERIKILERRVSRLMKNQRDIKNSQEKTAKYMGTFDTATRKSLTILKEQIELHAERIVQYEMFIPNHNNGRKEKNHCGIIAGKSDEIQINATCEPM